jgi:hypothetical protein
MILNIKSHFNDYLFKKVSELVKNLVFLEELDISFHIKFWYDL